MLLWLHTVRHQQVGQNGDAGQDQAPTLREPATAVAHGDVDDHLGGDVRSAEYHLNQVDVHAKLLEVHGEAVVAKASGEPVPQAEVL